MELGVGKSNWFVKVRQRMCDDCKNTDKAMAEWMTGQLTQNFIEFCSPPPPRPEVFSVSDKDYEGKRLHEG